MLQRLTTIDLGFGTLLCVLLLPFLFFVYRAKFKHTPTFITRADWLYSAVLILLLVALAVRLTQLDAGALEGQLRATLLHALPLLYALFSVFFTRSGDATSAAIASGAASASLSQSQPLNDQVEELSWDSMIIGKDLERELKSVIRLLKNPKSAVQYGIEVPKGILLNGPPGTGKTTIAKVVANEAGLSFFALKLDEVISKWVGESEKNLSALFESAKAHAPAVLFIDEIDAIGKQRSGSGGQEHREGFLNHLLQLMDGVVKTEGLYIIAATNRADLVDSALKRPGRLNKVIEIGLPDFEARVKLFQLYLAKLKLDTPIDTAVLSEITDGLSPAVIREICNQAGLNAFQRESDEGRSTGVVTREDLEKALAEHT